MRELGSVLQATPLYRYEGALWRELMLRVDLRWEGYAVMSRAGPGLGHRWTNSRDYAKALVNPYTSTGLRSTTSSSQLGLPLSSIWPLLISTYSVQSRYIHMRIMMLET